MTLSASTFIDNLSRTFREHTAVSILDILFTALLLYALFYFLKKRGAVRLIKYVIALFLVSAVLSSRLLGFTVMSKVFDYTIIVAVIAFIALFPQEIRRGLYRAASSVEHKANFSTDYDCSDEELTEAVTEIVRAVLNMAKKNVGALIIVTPGSVPEHILESGTELDSKLSSPLIESIFNTKAPLHDGAVFIHANRIMSAGCFLPLSQDINIDKELGTRHRAAIGITEVYSEMYAIIVSEETGVISTASGGVLTRYIDAAILSDALSGIYGLKAVDKSVKKKRRLRKSDGK